MNALSGVDPAAPRAVLAPAEDALARFTAKVAAGGDLASECLVLFSEDNASQTRINLGQVRLQHTSIRKAQKRRLELMRKRWAAAKKSGFWSKLGKIFSSVAAAIGVLCPAGALVGLGGAALAGGCKLASSAYDGQAARAAADILKQESLKEAAEGTRDEIMQSLQAGAEVERRMLERIQALAESEQKSFIPR